MKKTFSIITITKNSLPQLKRTFESLKRQTLKDFEWIVIDGASEDRTRDWLANLPQKNFDLLWISECDGGISDAWNKGIRMCNGSQILILNAGDTYDSNMIEIYQKKVRSDKITCAHARLIDPNSLQEVGIFKAEPWKLWRGMHLPHNWCAVPADFYKIYGDYPLLKYAMDFAWFHKYYKTCNKNSFEIIDKVLGSYYTGGISDKKYIQSFILNKNIIMENGCNKYLSLFILILYVSKHSLNNLIKNIK